jgi:hypothetical protein
MLLMLHEMRTGVYGKKALRRFFREAAFFTHKNDKKFQLYSSFIGGL